MLSLLEGIMILNLPAAQQPLLVRTKIDAKKPIEREKIPNNYCSLSIVNCLKNQ